MEIYERLAYTIKEARLRNALSQEQLAELVDVTPTHIKHLESGHRKPSVELLFTLAKQLHFSMDAVLTSPDSHHDPLIDQLNTLLPTLTQKEKKVLLALSYSLTKNR
ncbi:MAG: helix-turn-helix transcriptional regulator [Clostridia bacterium]|nr:helix-turn-helix transcriptional regulator [Clostridia bacterium]